jgi:hypothetical protein
MSTSSVFNLITKTGEMSELIYAFDLLESKISEYISNKKVVRIGGKKYFRINDYKYSPRSINDKTDSIIIRINTDNVDYVNKRIIFDGKYYIEYEELFQCEDDRYKCIRKDRNKYIILQSTNTQQNLYIEVKHIKIENYCDSAVNSILLPNIQHLEKTHNVYVSGTYKPSVPIAFEYDKLTAPNPQFGNTIKFTMNKFGNFVNDIVIHIRLTGLRALDNRDRVRYIAFLGHKIFKKVSFSINGNPLDEYTTEDYNNYYFHQLNEGKKLGWLRCIGQEIPHTGFITSDPTFDMFREYRLIGDGNQTLKQRHDKVDLFIPLLFWFCMKPSNSLISSIIPWGQTDINIDMAAITDIVGFADYGGGGLYQSPTIEKMDMYTNNIFVPPCVSALFDSKYIFRLIRVHLKQNFFLNSQGESSGNLHLYNLKWPIETIFINFRPRSNLELSQHWYKSSQLIQKNIKTPIVAKNPAVIITGNIVSATTQGGVAQAIISGVGLSGVDNAYLSFDFVLTGGPGYNSADIVQNRYTISNYNGTTREIILNQNWIAATPTSETTYELFTPQLAINLITYYQENPVVNQLSLVSSGITLYRQNTEGFFGNYTTYRYGENWAVPEDIGHYMINFNLFPDKYDPSGDLNVSNSRELYLTYNSEYISSENPVDVNITAKAINFLIVSNGSAILKYSN